jgi:hypothetical protein
VLKKVKESAKQIGSFSLETRNALAKGLVGTQV